MHRLRSSIRLHPRLALVLIALALCIKAAMPAGYMVAPSSETVMTVVVCTDSPGGVMLVKLSRPAGETDTMPADGPRKDGHCAFSGLAEAAIGGADAALLALAFAFILVLGLAPARRLPFRQVARLRPPLRGPPATA